MPRMLDQLLADAKAAILKRNPGLQPHLQPGIRADEIRKDLKRAGILGNVDEVIAVFSDFNGAIYSRENEASRLAFAPPIVKTIHLPPETLHMLGMNGMKVEPTRQIYGTFYFPRWEGVIFDLKTWRKFASNPRNGVLVGRVVPFFVYGETHQALAFDTDPSANGRILSLQPREMKNAPPLTHPYTSLSEFLQDLIEANRTSRHLAWPARLGPPVELPLPAAAPRPARSKRTTLPTTDKLLLIRTDFSDDAAWESLQSTLIRRNAESTLPIEFISDAAFTGLTAKQLPKHLPDGHSQPIAVLADQASFITPDPTLLVVALQDRPGRSFRTLQSCLPEVFDNLSVANMEFGEFIKAAKADGVYRGSQE
jgi:hypothetical protein